MNLSLLRFRLPGLMVCILALAPLSLAPAPTARAAFVVDSTTDAVDANPGDELCATEAGECTLRAAIQETNALAGADSITLPAGTYALTIPGDDENQSATGDLDITDNLTLTGAGIEQTTVDGNGSVTGDRAFHIRGVSPTVTLSGLSIVGGQAEMWGGGIRNAGTLTLTASRVSGNEAANGGGTYNEATLTLNESTFTGNAATGTFFAGGGAIYNSGALTVNTSTLSGNFSGDRGGGIYNDSVGVTEIASSTISGNNSGHGGGLFNERGTVTASNSTITGNSVRLEGGGIYHHLSGSVTIDRTVLAGNTSEDFAPAGPDCRSPYGPFNSGGHNLLGNNEGCNFVADEGDQIGTPGDPIDPVLGPLQDNGGPTLTHALLPDSPAIDAGSPDDCPSTDQRGFPRPVDGDGDGEAICDIGAYEFDSAAPDFYLRHDPDVLDVCAPADALYEIRVGSEGGYADPVALEALGVPPGASFSFDPNPVTPPAISAFTVSDTGAAAPGSYELDVVGLGSSSTHTTTMTLNLYSRRPARVRLLEPPDGAMDQPLQPTFTWRVAFQAGSYIIQIALDSGFTDVVEQVSGIEGTSYTLAGVLEGDTRYYWRVRGENACAVGRYSLVFSFRTGTGASVISPTAAPTAASP